MLDTLLLPKKLIVFFGMTASGKSFLAKEWARRHGYQYCNTDVIRKELAARTFPKQLDEGGMDQGIYSPGFSRKTYDTLLDRAEGSLSGGSALTVILDGSFHLRRERIRVTERFSGKVSICFIFCRCSERITKKRIEKRILDASAISDGTYEVYLKQKEKFENPDEFLPGELLELDTEAPLEYLIARLDKFFTPG